MKGKHQMSEMWSRTWKAVLVCGAVAVAVGCSSGKRGPAPVEDRGVGAPTSPLAGTPPANVKLLPGSENAGRPGYYTVKPGDTLIRIGLEHGQNWRDLVRWNALGNPNALEVGQVLRIVPPAPSPAPVVADATPSGVVVRPIPSSTLTTGTGAPTTPARPAAPAASQATTGTPGAATAPSAAPVNDEELAWIWPVPGSVLAGYDEAKNKGIDIAGKAGDPVLASADGRVVYAGSGLRGYGNLIILKHNNTYLSAYAHNQALLVKEDQAVRKGQKIAEMGNSDADQVKLHFEIRRQGKPVDPAKYLPAR